MAGLDGPVRSIHRGYRAGGSVLAACYPRAMSRKTVFFLMGALFVVSAWAAPGDSAVLQAQQAYAARKLANLERAARDVPVDHVL